MICHDIVLDADDLERLDSGLPVAVTTSDGTTLVVDPAGLPRRATGGRGVFYLPVAAGLPAVLRAGNAAEMTLTAPGRADITVRLHAHLETAVAL